MFLKIYQKIISIITLANLGFTEILMYKGELEEGTEFRATFPICYVEFTGDNVTDYGASGEAIDSLTGLEIYVCDKDTEEPKILEKVQQVIDLFDGDDVQVTLSPGDVYTFKARYISTVLHAYIAGLGKAYKITIGIH